ncbi:MAG: helix-turn-helix transcriptional regulator [Tepidanaerobacteraceae bacterium]|nr:helix-turn-helix transcriptional regulator [Tepidanaerobacteraceae bacterium]
MTLGEKIAKLRAEHHLSQGDLAEKMSVSRQSISKWETGSSIPDLDKLVTLSELFDVSLDTLVKDQDPKENTDPQPSAPHQLSEKHPPRKIAGWILMGIGLLSVVLGLALNLLLAVLGVYLIVCGTICLTVKKHPEPVIGWGTFLPCAYFLPWFTSANMRMIFHPYSYQGGLGIQLIVSYAFWAMLFLLIFITVKNTRMKSHPFLFSGWAVFSQIYGFIPIAFRHTEETMKSYLVLSWCAIVILFVLLFFTGKCLYRYLQTRKQK